MKGLLGFLKGMVFGKPKGNELESKAESVLLFSKYLYLHVGMNPFFHRETRTYKQYIKCIRSVAKGFDNYDLLVEKCIKNSPYKNDTLWVLDEVTTPGDDLTKSLVSNFYLRYLFNDLEWFSDIFGAKLHEILNPETDALITLNQEAYNKYEALFLEMVEVSQFESSVFMEFVAKKAKDTKQVFNGLSEEGQMSFYAECNNHFSLRNGRYISSQSDLMIGFSFKMIHEIMNVSELSHPELFPAE